MAVLSVRQCRTSATGPQPSEPSSAREAKSSPDEKPSAGSDLTIAIKSIATGVPDIVRNQLETADDVATLFKSNPKQQQRVRRLYTKTQVQKRHLVLDPLGPTFDRSILIRERMNMFLEQATPMVMDVCSRALSGADITNVDQEIGMLVLVTSTGFVAPGLDIAIIKQLGLSPSVSRTIVNFMGCAAAMSGLRVAADFASAHPKSKALVCCVELSSVNAVFKDDLNDVIISSLFADGCAAMVVGSDICGRTRAGDIILRHQFSHLVDDTADGITLGVNADGITCELSPQLPAYIYAGLDPIISRVLKDHGWAKSDLGWWAIHPGGPKIIEESVRSLGLDNKIAAVSWEVLNEHGNMLSVSLPFVLERMVAVAKRRRHMSKGIAFSFGPGITIEGTLFEVVGCT